MPVTKDGRPKPLHKRLDPSTPLGPQCVRCRRRRVKCDSTKPNCVRCQHDGQDCPGYGVRGTTWTVKTQASMAGEKDNSSRSDRSSEVLLLPSKRSYCGTESFSAATSTYTTSEIGNAVDIDFDTLLALESSLSESGRLSRRSNVVDPRKSRLAPLLSHLWEPLIPLLMPDPPRTPGMTVEDRNAYLFSDCLMYYNRHMCPLLVGCLLPNQTRDFDPWTWVTAPPLMKHNTVYAMATHRIARGEDGSAIQMQLHAHRGKTIELLHQALSALGKTAWSALCLIVMFLGGELGVSAISGWETHYDMAWRVVEMQGGDGGIDDGVTFCWDLGEEPQLACIYLLQIEVFSGTTSPVWTLAAAPDRRALQTMNREDLPDLEDRFLVSTCPCPLAIAKIVAEINDLRSILYALRSGNIRTLETGSVWSARLWDALMQLLCFQSEPWVARILSRHEREVIWATEDGGFDREEMAIYWAKLADCYRSAAVVYLIRSCSSARLAKSMPEECRDFFNDAEKILDEHRQSLSNNLAFLLEGLGTKREDLRKPVLWRFILWPLFVDAYEAVGWPRTSDSGKSNGGNVTGASVAHQERLIQRLRVTGRELGANCLLNAATLLEDVQEQWQARDSWDWDDAFPRRVVFSI